MKCRVRPVSGAAPAGGGRGGVPWWRRSADGGAGPRPDGGVLEHPGRTRGARGESSPAAVERELREETATAMRPVRDRWVGWRSAGESVPLRHPRLHGDRGREHDARHPGGTGERPPRVAASRCPRWPPWSWSTARGLPAGPRRPRLSRGRARWRRVRLRLAATGPADECPAVGGWGARAVRANSGTSSRRLARRDMQVLGGGVAAATGPLATVRRRGIHHRLEQSVHADSSTVGAMVVPAVSARRTARSAGTRAVGSGGGRRPEGVGTRAVVRAGGDDPSRHPRASRHPRVAERRVTRPTSWRASSSRLTVEAPTPPPSDLAGSGASRPAVRAPRRGPSRRPGSCGAAAPRPW